jgi:hypothetical protein
MRTCALGTNHLFLEASNQKIENPDSKITLFSYGKLKLYHHKNIFQKLKMWHIHCVVPAIT